MVYLCGVSPLAWAVGAYLPLATTLAIFVGGLMRGLADKLRGEPGESEISPGMLFATGLVAGGSLAGIATGSLKAFDRPTPDHPDWTLLEHLQHPGELFQKTLVADFGTYAADLMAVACFGLMCAILLVVGLKKTKALPPEALRS
jgi:hypothetical protein